ncbi:unnamed protein product [Arabidopsis lyrata]|uniref:Predicted protein n=1 Tax=Arabidopsis lyrata subsp. lyrata TaxID=81972 RepID=D7LBI5_ARALL|nr:predicted protein [Arabidopsis lyrata subsp. lyrata]CAH8263592.1 unnamed protein product [Arabidopsis lyrata]
MESRSARYGVISWILILETGRGVKEIRSVRGSLSKWPQWWFGDSIWLVSGELLNGEVLVLISILEYECELKELRCLRREALNRDRWWLVWGRILKLDCVLKDLKSIQADALYGHGDQNDGDEEVDSRVLNPTMRSSFVSIMSCFRFGSSRVILRIVSNRYVFQIWFSLVVSGFDVEAFNGGLQWLITNKEKDSSQSKLMWMDFRSHSWVISQICIFDSSSSIWEDVFIFLLLNFRDYLVPNWFFGKHSFGFWLWKLWFVFYVTLYMLNDLVFCFYQSFETEDQALLFNGKIWMTRLQNLGDHGNEGHKPTHHGTVKGFTGGRNPPKHKVDK